MTTKVKSKNTIKFKDIKSPKTVEEFRENLRKYYCNDFGKTLMNNLSEIVVINKLNSMDELYELGDHLHSDYPPICLTPTIVLEKQNKDKNKYLKENEIIWNTEEISMDVEKVCQDFWKDEDNFTIYENDQHSFIKHQTETHNDVYWIDYWKYNTLFREFYQKTLGDFSGYGEYEEEVK